MTAAVTRDALALQGTFDDIKSINEALRRAAEVCHLVTPAASVGQLPEGFSIGLSLVLVDVERETYKVGGAGVPEDEDDERGKRAAPGQRRALGKSALNRIALAAGISWDPVLSGRVDDAKDAFYVMWRAVGHLRLFDNTDMTLPGHRELDVRESSAWVQDVMARAKVSTEKWERSRRQTREPDPEKEIRFRRMHILSLCESMAKLRAVRDLGLYSSYTVAELQKPFAVARLMATGQSEDPVLRRAFALKNFEAAMAPSGAAAMLYGTRPALPDPTTRVRVADFAGPAEEEPEAASAPARAKAAAPTARAAPAKATPPAPAPPPLAPTGPAGPGPVAAKPPPPAPPSPPPAGATYSGVVIPGGNSKGLPIEEADDRDLEYWVGALSRSGSPFDLSRARAMKAEIDARRAGRAPSGDGERF